MQIYAVSITIRIVVCILIICVGDVYAVIDSSMVNSNIFVIFSIWQFGFMFIALIWKFDFAPFMVLIIAILNDGETFISLSISLFI